MVDVLFWLLEVLWVWGVVLGVLAAFIVSASISFFLWGEWFHAGLFGALSFVFAIVGLYIQLQVDLKQIRERRKYDNDNTNNNGDH